MHSNAPAVTRHSAHVENFNQSDEEALFCTVLLFSLFIFNVNILIYKIIVYEDYTLFKGDISD